MSQTILFTIGSITILGFLAAAILYFIASKFKVYEDPKIDEVEEALPNTNCGGCGHPGCRAFAEACVKANDLSDLHCPVGGNETMQKVASILGMEVEERDPYVAVVRCSGSFEYREKVNVYDGSPNCTVAHSLYGGDTGCQYGCLGFGECVDACDFEAMYMDEKTGLPVVIEDKCTACNACVKACPRDILELRPKGKRNRRIYVSCINQDKGGAAKKACEVACTGCSKCEAECKYDAITIQNYLAYIDADKCKSCRKCAPVCKSNSILEINFPPIKLRPEKPEREKRERPERPERNAQPVAADTAAIESDAEVDVIEMVKKANEENTNEQNSENKENS
jgi:Na+-translocating ferredoxin:NAD+ oxidoreductase RNF subunit RnfB